MAIAHLIVMNSHLDIGLTGWSGQAVKLNEQGGSQQTVGLFQQYLDKNSGGRLSPALDTLPPDAILSLASKLMLALDRASMHAMFFDLNDGQGNSRPSLLSTDQFMSLRKSPKAAIFSVQEKPMNLPISVAASPVSAPNSVSSAVPVQAPIDEPAIDMNVGTKIHVKVRPPSDLQGEYASIIASAAATHGLDPKLIEAVVHTESGFDARAVSPVGAQGLMQLMPGTAAELGVSDAFDPEQNIQAGSKYLKQLMNRYHGDVGLALAAYNWGMGNLERHPERMPQETVNYVAKVTGLMNKAA